MTNPIIPFDEWRRAGALLNELSTSTALRPADRVLLREITASLDDSRATRRLIHHYYSDLDRADRTPRPFLYLHMGMLMGMLLAEGDD
jgi:hypothetical protein